jgi:NAD(P)H-hydrate epimerase
MEKADALAIGPGLGRDPETDACVHALIEASAVPVVLDADGINAFAGHTELLRAARCPLVITPHSGELERLIAARVEKTPLAKIEQTARTAKELGAVVLHKGAPSVIASPEGEVLINLHGTSALATGGTGDVLTGLVGSFLAQGANPLDAAAVGSFLLGRSGEHASVDRGLRGVIAGDLLAYLGPAMVELEESLPRPADG